MFESLAMHRISLQRSAQNDRIDSCELPTLATACCRLLRACSSRRSGNAFFAGFFGMSHGIYVAAGIVGLCSRSARLEVGKHFRVTALGTGGAIKFCQ